MNQNDKAAARAALAQLIYDNIQTATRHDADAVGDAALAAGWRPPVAVAALDRTELVRILGDGQYQTTTAMADAILAAGFARAKTPAVPPPAPDAPICRVCDGGPGNNGVCLCGERAYDAPPAPAPVGHDSIGSATIDAPAPDGAASQLEAVRLAALAVMGDQYQKHATLQIVELALAELTAKRNYAVLLDDIRRHVLAAMPAASPTASTPNLISALLADYAALQSAGKTATEQSNQIGRAYRALERITTARPDRDIVDMATAAADEFELLRSRRDCLKNVLADTERSRTELQAELASLLQVRARATTALATLNGLLTNAAADSVDDAADLVAELLASIRTTLADESKRLDAMNVTLHNAAAERGRMAGLLNSTKAAIGDAQLEIAGIPAAVAALRADLRQAQAERNEATATAARLDGELRLALSRVASHAEELDRMTVAAQTSRSQEIRRLSLALMTAAISNPNMTKAPTWPGCVASIKELFAITEGPAS